MNDEFGEFLLLLILIVISAVSVGGWISNNKSWERWLVKEGHATWAVDPETGAAKWELKDMVVENND